MRHADPDGVQVYDRDGVRTISLDRPNKLNAFSCEQYRNLRKTLAEVSDDAHTACVVLTGNGRAFSAGSDLTDDAPASGDDDPYQDCIELIEAYPKPLIVAVNGLAVGIGLTMLGHADLVLAGSSARFRAPFAALGLVPEAGSTVTLPTLLGPQNAAHLLFTGEWLSAPEAQQYGLVWRVVPDSELLTETARLADQIAAMPVESLVAIKGLLLQSRLDAVRLARNREDAEFVRLLTGPAHLVALEQFQQRPQRKSG